MINTNNTEKPDIEVQDSENVDKPDENGGVYVQGFFKIHDPESGEIICQGRS